MASHKAHSSPTTASKSYDPPVGVSGLLEWDLVVGWATSIPPSGAESARGTSCSFDVGRRLGFRFEGTLIVDICPRTSQSRGRRSREQEARSYWTSGQSG